MAFKAIDQRRVTSRASWAWLLPILALSPLSLATKGCANSAVVGDNCAAPDDCPSAAAGNGGAEPENVCGGLLGTSCSDERYCEYPKTATCGEGDQTGVCQPKPTACDLVYSPVCGCDGKTYGNDCDAQLAGVSVARAGECEGGGGAGGGNSGTGETCGGIAALECAEGLYCNFAVETQCGSGDQTGTCTPVPEGCSKELNQVCGCNDVSYGNPCMAAAARVSVAYQGACRAAVVSCGEIGGCAPDEFCNFPPESRCGLADGPGVCTALPPKGTACDSIFAPVCGCDGKTYDSDCEARVAGVSVASTGECGSPSGAVCGGITGACKEGYYCAYPLGSACGAADELGTCEPIPDVCDLKLDPVCGCDGEDYSSACEAASKGTAAAYEGNCKK